MQARTLAAIPGAFARLDRLEARLCRPVNGAARFIPAVREYFAVVSRLGDGIGWYGLLAVVPLLHGMTGLLASAHMALTGVVGVLIYRVLKSRLVRERPFHSHRGIRALVDPLDRYSFPSGHTLHAVCFSCMLWQYCPELCWLAIPFAISVAASRVVLGLHYPSDVLAGAAIGWTLATGSLAISA
jgi:undecaprenyl-diphosphatase